MDPEQSQDEREVRIARNQALFRAVNEQIKTLAATEPLPIACECADTSCVQMLHIQRDEYADVRRNPRHFAVLPGHVYPDVEAVVRESEGCVVVEKFAAAGALAAELDANAETTGV